MVDLFDGLDKLNRIGPLDLLGRLLIIAVLLFTMLTRRLLILLSLSLLFVI